jgi:hypothetical protein
MPTRHITVAEYGHMLTNVAVWSPDSCWIVYDIRSAADGGEFDGTRIERVEVQTGRVEVLYESRHGATCGVVTCSPLDDRVAFILGPEYPTADWAYGPARRQGVVVRTARPGKAEALDARDMAPPFTVGALRGGSHVHVFSADAEAVSFTYEDALLEGDAGGGLRGVGVSACGRPVHVPDSHPRNHDGSAFSVLVTRLVAAPRPDGDEISRACEEGWIGTAGYRRGDGSRQRRALAFQGHVRTAAGGTIAEVFVVDLPDDLADLVRPGEEPLTGTPGTLPAPPRGVSQRRITTTAERRHPGIQGPRHWLRSSPDGERIAVLMKDDAGIVQIYTVSPRGGSPEQLTRLPWPIASSFTWSPDGGHLACVVDGSVCLVDAVDGSLRRLTPPEHGATGPRPEACVFSPDGSRVAYVRRVPGRGGLFNQVFVVETAL